MAGKTIEVDESDFLQTRQLRGVVEKIMANPEARKLVLKGKKIAFPDEHIEELDGVAATEARKAEEIALAAAKRMDDFVAAQEAKEKARQFTDAWENQKNDMRRQGWTEEGLAKVEEHATKEGIPNLRAAAADWEKLNPPATPVAPGSPSLMSFSVYDPDETQGAYIKALMEKGGDEPMTVDRRVSEALAEIRGTVRR